MEKTFFKRCMDIVEFDKKEETLSLNEHYLFANKQLLIAINCEINKKLKEIANSEEEHWSNTISLDIQSLYNMRDKALIENDHVGVLCYTGMIAMREELK